MRTKPLLLGLIVGIGFLWLALREVELAEVADAIAGAEWWTVAPFLLGLCAFYWLKAIRWRLLIHASRGISTRQLIGPLMVGFAANNFLPFRAGEVVRILLASRTLALPKTYVLANVVLERFLDLLAVAILVAVSLIYLAARGLMLDNPAGLYLGTGAAVIICLASLALAPKLIRVEADQLTGFLPDRLQRIATPYLERFLDGLEPAIVEGKSYSVIINSLLQWAILTGCIYISFAALGLEHSYAVAAVVLGITVLAISLPSSPGYIGTIEFSFVFGLSLFGGEPDLAMAAALFYHALSFLFVTVVGLACYLRLRSSSSRNRQ